MGRMWVLSLPFALRYRLAYDAIAVSAVLRVFVRAIFESLRRRARDNGIHNTQCGAVTFIQRFGSALNLCQHLRKRRKRRHSPRFAAVPSDRLGLSPAI